jgi:hypothetical protein
MITRAVSPAFIGLLALGMLLSVAPGTANPAAPAPGAPAANPAWQVKAQEILGQLPPPIKHFADLPEADARARLSQERNSELVLRAKLADRWFAALLSTASDNLYAIERSFDSWRDFIEFLVQKDALVEVWAYPEGARGQPRRIPATELAALKRLPREPPTFITVTFRDAAVGQVRTYRVEFGFHAAEVMLAAHRGYERHRELQWAAREFLGARDAEGRFSAVAQWERLQRLADEQRLPIAEMPPRPPAPRDLFVAVEYEVDELNNFTRVVRTWRESELRRRIVNDTQVLVMQRHGEKTERFASGYRQRGVTDVLEPVPAPILGQDQLELRIHDPAEPDVRRWQVLEFGEPEIVRQSALSRFALINAHLERQRKAILVKKSKLDLIAEPLIAVANISGGLTGVPFPVGDAVRLAYNVISPAFIPDVPTTKKFRELFAILAARERDPTLKTKPLRYLSQRDLDQLAKAGRKLSDREVHDALDRISEEDLRGMSRLAAMGMWDARFTALLNILTGAGKVSGETEAGLDRDFFNSVYFSLNGDINLKTIFAVFIGKEIWTPLSGVSLESLGRGEGPAEAWLQFFDFSVNLRALANTVARLTQRSLADKELNKPFPYAPRLSDLAAYEFRAFGFPLLIFYKRGLLKKDLDCYDRDFAYGLLGVRIVERFPTRADFDREVRARRMVPLGFVRVLGKQGQWRETNLPVFAHRMAAGRHKGKTSIIIYGLKAYQEHSEYIERELERFKSYERALREGAVIEQIVDAEDLDQIPAREFEPKLMVGTNATEEIFAPLLGRLQEVRRAQLRKEWALPLDAADEARLEGIQQDLAALNIRADDPEAFQGVDRFHSLFLYRQQVEGKWRLVKMVALPGLADIARELRKAEEAQRIAELRRQAAEGKTEGLIIINRVEERGGKNELGPLWEKPPAEDRRQNGPSPQGDRRPQPEPRAEAPSADRLVRDSADGAQQRADMGVRAPLVAASTSLTFWPPVQPESLGFVVASADTPTLVGTRSTASQHPSGVPLQSDTARWDFGGRSSFPRTSWDGRTPPGDGWDAVERVPPGVLAAANPGAGQTPRTSSASSPPPLSLRSGAKAIDEIFDLLNQLPVTDRARLRFNHFAATVVNLDVDGDGQRERVFLTIEFPLGEVRREWTNPLSGEREQLVFENGLWKRAITDRRIVEIDYDEGKAERASRTYANRGTLAAPVGGELLEETRTLETWLRDLSAADLDPYLPLLSKLHLNHVTGQVTRETFGLFPLPVEIVDDRFVTRNRYNPHGIFASAQVFDNGASEADFARPLMQRLLRPVVGRARFELTSTSGNLQDLWNLSAQDFKTTVVRRDLVKGLSKTQVFDNARFGRKVSENYLDVVDATQSFPVVAALHYHDDFHFGLIPTNTVVVSLTSSKALAEVTTLAYDAATRRLTGLVTDYTGKTTTNTWDYRWENPTEVATALRKTISQYDRDETSVTSTTTANASGEAVASASGAFDPTTKTWQVRRRLWYRPEVLLRAETDTLSAFGKLIATRVADEFESRPIYDLAGIEIGRRTFRRDTATGQFTLPHRMEEDYRWQAGQREARVRTFVEGQAYDEFRTITDSEGRTLVDAIKSLPGLELRSVATYDGCTERRLKADSLQNGAPRVTHEFLGEQRQADGTFWLQVKGTPFWGLTFTNTFRLDDPLARPLSTVFENGERSRVTEWFPGVAIARVSELSDRHGRVRERWVSRLFAGTNATLPFDHLMRFKVGYRGNTGLVEERGLLRGTDLVLFSDAPEQRIYFDPEQRHDVPRYAIDPRGRRGVSVVLDGGQRARATALFRRRFAEHRDPQHPTKPAEPVLVVESLDLQGLFFHKFTRTTYDRAGRTLLEEVGKIPNPGLDGYAESALFAAVERAAPTRRFVHHYAPGWFGEARVAGTDTTVITFTDGAPPPGIAGWSVNGTGWRDTPTAVDGRLLRVSDERLTPAAEDSIFRRLGRPMELRSNPHLPDVTDVWTAWSVAEVDADRQALYESEVIFNARGHPSTTLARKRNSAGERADKIAYHLCGPAEHAALRDGPAGPPAPAAETSMISALQAGTNRVSVTLPGARDVSDCDFLCLYATQPPGVSFRLELQDAAGQSALIGDRLEPGAQRSLQFWPVASGQIKWTPDEILPRHGAVVEAPAFTEGQAGSLPYELAQRFDRALVVAVTELDKAGLDIRRLAGATLVVESPATNQLRFTSLQRLAHGGRFIAEQSPGVFSTGQPYHSSELATFTREKLGRTRTETATGKGWHAVARLDGFPVATAQPRDRWPPDAALTLLDYSDADAPRPLYALQTETGDFLEYYHSTQWGDAQVYSVVSGFETPKLEIFRAGVLDDEIAPGLLAYGRDVHVTLPLAKASGGLSRLVANLHNRMIASIFTVGGDRVLSLFAEPSRPAAELVRLNQQFGRADKQADDIAKLPLLAQALLPRRELPWQLVASSQLAVASNAAGLPTPNRHLATRLNRLAANYQEAPERPGGSGLIPTAPGTEVERYVDTVKEGELIQLAVRLGEPALAAALLQFYVDQSANGSNLLHASYDAVTRANLGKDPRHERAFEAPRTAEAQLSIAEAAFRLGVATGDTNALLFGRTLVTNLLFHFVSPTAPAPTGLVERLPQHRRTAAGLTLWPAAHQYSLRSNARAYLLLRQLLDESMRPFVPSDAFRVRIEDALKEQAAWLRTNAFPHLEQTGVAPKGVFELQDITHGTSRLAPERWTTAEDWLWCIEAADRMGETKETTRRWLENLARVHGVTVAGVWGLDWCLGLLRDDAVSPELTARFARVAELVGHREATGFARTNLAALWRAANFTLTNATELQRDGRFPVVWTPAPPRDRLDLGEGSTVYPRVDKSGWSETLTVFWQLVDHAWRPVDSAQVPVASRRPGLTTDNRPLATAAAAGGDARGPADGAPRIQLGEPETRDITVFLWTAAGLYLVILLVALLWWHRSAQRKQRRAVVSSGPLVPAAVMQRAEERWAKRVLGAQTPPNAERSRYSNCAIEQNFHMQLRAIYKLVLEWRRACNGWEEDDPRLVEDASDPWLNGLDEFATLAGIYSRFVVKAGKKDGFPQADVLAENEDSNHIWSRLVMYFSEHHWALLEGLRKFKADPAAAFLLGGFEELEGVLRAMGVRERIDPFDAREAFAVPAKADAMDLLALQLPGATLSGLVDQMEATLRIPRQHVIEFIRSYKAFKHREQLFPVHPYVLEAAKLLPHCLLMSLVALIWFNIDIGGLPIYPYLKQTALQMVSWGSLLWAGPLAIGYGISVAANYLGVYRHEQKLRGRTGHTLWLEATLTSFFKKGQTGKPTMKESRWWDPVWYLRVGWTLRALGLFALGAVLLRLDTPSFATFLFVKGMIAGLVLIEAGAIFLPLILSWVSMWLEDRVSGQLPVASRQLSGVKVPNWRLATGNWLLPLMRFLNQLNLTATRPASVLWKSFKYHFQPSVPTGDAGSLALVVIYYLALAAVFFAGGGYVSKEVLRVWFADTYRYGWDFKLLLGALLFWNTMYLLRFGLHVLFTGTSAFVVTFPIKALVAAFTLGYVLTHVIQVGLQGQTESFVTAYPTLSYGVLIVLLALAVFEDQFLAWLKSTSLVRRRREARAAERRRKLDEYKSDSNRAFGVVYMSGDDLSYLKLTPELLMSRWTILRDKLDSGGLRLLAELHDRPDDATLAEWFKELYELEKKHDVTLWHPMQIVLRSPVASSQLPVVSGQLSGAESRHWQLTTDNWQLPPELGLNLPVDGEATRQRLLRAWHIRRWLVTMMSTAGHSQDTAITLVDIALRLAQEGLAANTAFFLIQNKYDNADNNRPSQLAYDKGELGQRNKLARLLMEIAPGSRAYSLTDWTPFGFKAGGLVGMDLVHEEALKLTNMLVMDRNATVHDLDALMEDITTALTDPGVVIIVPGRSTTNTLTPIGQGSQLVEEGHRAMLKGFRLLGGSAAESIGTGWGNLQAIFYGRVQRALCDPEVPRMPLTSRQKRGTPFGDRFEGLIGFGPHAVGISEDIWGVTQAAHNAIALGIRPKFEVSRAFWHKIRETWSHAEWFSAFTRWSGGFLQMMHDPMMQRVKDEGPLSPFAKELRANNGRFYLTAPFAMLNILLMPLAIILGVSPFIQILVVLWNFGFVLNQVLTLHGLVACLEATGFYRSTALAGAALAGSLSATIPGWNPFAPGLIAGGFLAGGFALGLGRWLYDRGRDIILFGPQLVIHALGQFVRQSLEFVLSGASANDAKAVNVAFRAWVGPREDRPFEGYANLVNLRTVVWIVGIASLMLNLFSLSQLDFLNVVLLLPSLLFSVSVLLGPFIMRPRAGTSVGRRVWIVKLAGWLAAFGFFALVAWLLARGGWSETLAVLCLTGCLGALLWQGLRYIGYGRKLKRLTAQLTDLLANGGLASREANQLAGQIVRGFVGDPAKTQTALTKAGLASDRQPTILAFVQAKLLPHLKKPMADLETGLFVPNPKPETRNPKSEALHRWLSEFGRSFALAVCTFLWFFIVPIPGLFVLSVFEYRVSLDLSTVLLTVAGAVGVAIAALLLSLGFEWFVRRGLAGRGLLHRVTDHFHRFESLLRGRGQLSPAQSASLHALFTDVQTYFDQRGLAHARRTLVTIERKLAERDDSVARRG